MPKKVLWFYAGQISTLQLGIGALFGFKRAVSILQMEFSNTTYHEVFTLYGKENARQLKNVSVKEDYQYIQSELLINEPHKNELGFIIYLGSHNPIGEAKAYCKKQLQINNFLIIQARKSGGNGNKAKTGCHICRNKFCLKYSQTRISLGKNSFVSDSSYRTLYGFGNCCRTFFAN